MRRHKITVLLATLAVALGGTSVATAATSSGAQHATPTVAASTVTRAHTANYQRHHPYRHGRYHRHGDWGRGGWGDCW